MCRYKKKIYDLVKEHVDNTDDVPEVPPSPPPKKNRRVMVVLYSFDVNVINSSIHVNFSIECLKLMTWVKVSIKKSGSL
jgi:hypothetical protein